MSRKYLQYLAIYFMIFASMLTVTCLSIYNGLTYSNRISYRELHNKLLWIILIVLRGMMNIKLEIRTKK